MSKVEVDTARLPLLLHDLRLPAISRLWPDIAARSDKEGWPAVRFLSALAEMEIAERAKRRVDRHLAESRLPPGKTLDSFDFSVVPMISKAHFMALAAGDTWLEKGSNLLLFGPPGSGKTHASAALGRTLIENGSVCCSYAPPNACSGSRQPVAPRLKENRAGLGFAGCAVRA
jgi:DNA replication protein DnaC